MKTLKITIIAALITCNIVGMANFRLADKSSGIKKIKNVTIEQALKISGLEEAMYHQINPDKLVIIPSHIYIATVTFQGTTFLISGTLDQWVRFFRKEGMPQVNKQRPCNIL